MTYSILDFGADASGVRSSQQAIQHAIDAAFQAGGGTVLCPPGTFATGSVILKSNVELHLETGCRISGSLNPADYSRPEDVTGNSALDAVLCAAHAKNIRITGAGAVVDGNGLELMEDDPGNGGNGEEHLALRKNPCFRPKLLRFEDVEGAEIHGVTFQNSAFWTLHFAGCRKLFLHDFRVENHPRAANTDALDLDVCSDVILSGLFLLTGDDGVCVKSTREIARRYGVCENILCRGCIIHSTSGALKIGTETFGPIRNVEFTDCVTTNSSHALSVYSRDGGAIENIRFSNIRGTALAHGNAPRHRQGFSWWGSGDAVFVSAAKRSPRNGISPETPGKIQHVSFSGLDIDCESSVYLSSAGEDSPICDLAFDNCRFRFKRTGTQDTGFFDEQPSFRSRFPHSIPAFFLEHVDGAVFHNCQVIRIKPENEAWTGFSEIVQSRNFIFRDCLPENGEF